MAKLRLSVAARADLVEIRNFSLAEFGAEVADTYFRGFNQAFALLRERPFAGVTQPELGNDLRCFTQRRHRIFYRTDHPSRAQCATSVGGGEVNIDKPDWLRATPFGFANMAVIFGVAILLMVFVMLNKLSPENWIWPAFISVIAAAVIGNLLKLSDRPTCGKSPFRYGRRWGKWRFGRIYKAWPDRECSECGHRLDQVNTQ